MTALKKTVGEIVYPNQLDLTNLLRVKLSKKMITEEKTFLLIFYKK
jgi:hypothetical protein